MQDLSAKSAYELKTPYAFGRTAKAFRPMAAIGSKTFGPSSWQTGEGRADAARSLISTARA